MSEALSNLFPVIRLLKIVRVPYNASQGIVAAENARNTFALDVLRFRRRCDRAHRRSCGEQLAQPQPQVQHGNGSQHPEITKHATQGEQRADAHGRLHCRAALSRRKQRAHDVCNGHHTSKLHQRYFGSEQKW